MAKAEKGDRVRIHYNGFLEDGSIFESTIAEDLFEFVLGEGRVMSGVEHAVFGMSEGETKTVTVPPEKAYGHYDNSAWTTVEKTKIPSGIEPEIGMMLSVQTKQGEIKKVMVTDISEKTVTLDSNHPLVGKKLIFEIHLEMVLKPPA